VLVQIVAGYGDHPRRLGVLELAPGPGPIGRTALQRAAHADVAADCAVEFVVDALLVSLGVLEGVLGFIALAVEIETIRVLADDGLPSWILDRGGIDVGVG